MSNSSTKKCYECGNNQVNHQLLWLVQSLNIVGVPIVNFVEEKLPNISGFSDRISNGLVRVGTITRLVKLNEDVEKVLNTRSKVIWIEAKRRRLLVQQLIIFGKPGELFRVKIEDKWHYYNSLPIVYTKSSSYAWLDDKYRLKKYFQKNSVPTPKGDKFISYKKALNYFNKLSKPVVIKPVYGSRGRHTNTYIQNEQDFRTAFKSAKKICLNVMVEEMILGSIYRGSFVGNKTRAVLRGDFPHVIGDGKSSLQKLITKKNKSRSSKQAEVKISSEVVKFVKRQGYKLQDIPPKGTLVNLGSKIGIRYGGDAVEVSDKTHSSIWKAIDHAGKVLGADVVGFDFIVQDISKPIGSQNFGIIEANSLPFIDLHHYPRVGKPVNVAKYVWDVYLSNAKTHDQ